MIGSLIGVGISAAGSILGGMAASKAMKKYKGQIEAQKQENRSWYDRRYNEDPTQRASAQRILTITGENIRRRNQDAAGTAAVMGTGAEAVAAEKAGNNAVLAEAASRINAEGEQRKDAIESSYRNRNSQLQGQLDQLEVNRAMNTSSAIKGVLGSAGNISGLIDDYVEKQPLEDNDSEGKTISGLN